MEEVEVILTSDPARTQSITTEPNHRTQPLHTRCTATEHSHRASVALPPSTTTDRAQPQSTATEHRHIAHPTHPSAEIQSKKKIPKTEESSCSCPSDDPCAMGHVPVPLIFTQEQQKYVLDLNRKASSLSRSIHNLRLRLPHSDISQRLPDLHAHSLASNAALALQLNAHSTTREQAQLREVTLQEENVHWMPVDLVNQMNPLVTQR